MLTATHIFLTGHESDKLYVFALDRSSGRELWRREVPRAQKGRLDGPNGPASPSPVTDGDRVYAFFQDFGLIAFTTDGQEVWRRPLGPFNIFYGFGASPILVDGLLVLPVDQDSGSSARGRPATGDASAGRSSRRDLRALDAHGLRACGKPKQIIIPSRFQLSAYSVADGKRVWVRGLRAR